MFYIGLDAGTTSVCGVLLEDVRRSPCAVISREHSAYIQGTTAGEDIQDPDRIAGVGDEIIQELIIEAGGAGNIGGLCITGQVHGILYADSEGRAVSPFFTWQDRRARNPRPGSTEDWVSWINSKTGCIVPAGYGFITHLINTSEGKVPGQAASICTILDYLSMRITGNKQPSIDPTNAHTLGLFNLGQKKFFTRHLENLGINSLLLPEVVPVGTMIGAMDCGIPVYTAVGDNQAGFLGAVEILDSSVLINVGTSAQMTVYAADGSWIKKPELTAGWLNGLEIRPFLRDDYILTGASLAGGSAYRLLEQFFREICVTFSGSDPGSLFKKMNQADVDAVDPENRLNVLTHFYGTRGDQAATGTIEGIDKNNFNSTYLIEGFCSGVASELHQFFALLPLSIRDRIDKIIGVGNSLKKNPLLKRCIEETFNLPLLIPETGEEAALGAACIAAGKF